MTKSRVCVEKAVKLAKQNCAKKTNLLVYEKKSCEQHKPELKSAYKPPISSPKLKHIRVCTGAELKRICPPKLCDCPPKVPFSFIKKFQQLLLFGFKSALAFGLVYITVDLGIWGDSDRTEVLYRDICELYSQENKTRPKRSLPPSCEAEKELFNAYTKDACGCYKSLPIDHERSLHDYKQNWNKMVYVTFSSLVGFPYNFMNYIREKCLDKNEEIEMICELENIVPFDDDENDNNETGDGCDKCQ